MSTTDEYQPFDWLTVRTDERIPPDCAAWKQPAGHWLLVCLTPHGTMVQGRASTLDELLASPGANRTPDRTE